jgi:probable phosphoglycerate mutase
LTRFLLIRHGVTDVMTTHLAGRQSGIPLNRFGIAQATALAERLAKPDVLVTSPIQRARDTARIIGDRHGLTARLDNHFAEFEFGEWTGRSFESLQGDPRWLEFNRSRESASAPGGESMMDVQRRSVAGIVQLLGGYHGKTVAIVSHGDVIRSLLLHAAASSIGNYWRFTVEAASISELGNDGGAERILRVNDCAHLEHLAA